MTLGVKSGQFDNVDEIAVFPVSAGFVCLVRNKRFAGVGWDIFG
jgi:hypothetical protein